MATTNFSYGTVIASTWLNDVDAAVFETLPTLSTSIAALAPKVSPTLTTPVLGVATATSINKVTITAPETGATLTIPDGTTATVSGVNTGDQSLAGLAALAGGNTFTGVQKIPVVHSTVLALGSVSGTVNIDLALASTYTATITGVTAFTFSNAPPSGKDQTVYLKLTNAAAFATTFQAGTKYPSSGTLPVFTAAGKDLVGVWYDVEQTAYVVGLIWKDYK